jgi:hypothetical protein
MLLKKSNNWNSYLFEYNHDGSSWSFEIPARDEQEARERVNKLSYARYLGEIKLAVPRRYGLLARMACWANNLVR